MSEGVHIYKICKPAACSFIKKLTHLKRFKKDLAYFVEGHISRNTLECLHIIFIFFSATILQYKKLKISKFTFLMNLMMRSKESKVLYYGQVFFLLS